MRTTSKEKGVQNVEDLLKEILDSGKRKYSLKELRARNNLSQSDMAKRLGVSLTSYNKWEADLTNVKVSQLIQIADILGVDMSEIDF